jgi:MFS-type transporter involved in bile tolerance (Atg22 family)
MVLIVKKFLKNLKRISVLSTLSSKEKSGREKNRQWETDGTLGVILIISTYIFLLSPLWLPILLHGFGG